MLLLTIWSLIVSIGWTLFDRAKASAGLIVLMLAGSFITLVMAFLTSGSLSLGYLDFCGFSALSFVLFLFARLFSRSRRSCARAIEARIVGFQQK